MVIRFELIKIFETHSIYNGNKTWDDYRISKGAEQISTLK